MRHQRQRCDETRAIDASVACDDDPSSLVENLPGLDGCVGHGLDPLRVVPPLGWTVVEPDPDAATRIAHRAFFVGAVDVEVWPERKTLESLVAALPEICCNGGGCVFEVHLLLEYYVLGPSYKLEVDRISKWDLQALVLEGRLRESAHVID